MITPFFFWFLFALTITSLPPFPNFQLAIYVSEFIQITEFTSFVIAVFYATDLVLFSFPFILLLTTPNSSIIVHLRRIRTFFQYLILDHLWSN